MKQNIGLVAEIELVAKAGYNGIEIWIRTLEAFVKNGGKLSDVKQKANDLGIVIEDAIGFAPWIVDDPNERQKHSNKPNVKWICWLRLVANASPLHLLGQLKKWA